MACFLQPEDGPVWGDAYCLRVPITGSRTGHEGMAACGKGIHSTRTNMNHPPGNSSRPDLADLSWLC